MDDSIAILGRQPALGLAELESLYGPDAVTPLGTQAARVSRMACDIDFSRLGGTIKLCKLLSILDTTNWKKIEKFLVDASPDHSRRMPPGKMHLGLSVYGLNIAPPQLLATGLRLKKAIHQAESRSVHLVPNKVSALNSAQVTHNKLTSDNGWELIFVRHHEQTIIAQTVFVQDLESYTVRDRLRPKRDPRVGMLPPKLAQIIINLASSSRQPAGTTLLDPFCGTGVLLQEARLVDFSVQGTDVNPRMIDYTTQNLDWLEARYQLPAANYHLEVADATTHKWQPPIDIVATEAYLGRPFTTPPSPETLAQTISDCNLILKKFLQNLAPQISTDTRLCLAVPAWQTKPGQFRHLPLIDQPSDLGYNRISFKHLRDEDLLYYRADQVVARQLLVIKRK